MKARAEAAPKSRKHSTEKPHAGREAVTGSRQTKLGCAEAMGRRLAETTEAPMQKAKASVKKPCRNRAADVWPW